MAGSASNFYVTSSMVDGRFWRIVLKNSVLKPTVIADSFRRVGAGDRIDDGSAAG